MKEALNEPQYEDTSYSARPQPSAEAHARLIEHLFQEHNDSLLRFLRARLPSDADAHDVAQEAYVRLLSLDQPGAVSYLRAYLFKIASNLAVDRLRSTRRRSEAPPRLLFPERQSSEEDTALLREQLRMVRGYIDELPPKCRKAFLLNRLHGLGADEIAVMMNLSGRMIRKYLLRATEYCHLRLEQELRADGRAVAP